MTSPAEQGPAGPILGVDIGGTKTAVCLAHADGRIVARQAFATAEPQATIRRIVSTARRLAARFAGIGISCGGPLDWRAGIIQSPPNLPGWDDVAITDELQARLQAPAWLDNDANAGALAEWRFGAARQCQHLIFLTCGTGMGAGLILDGRLYRGQTGLAGEVGHIRLAEAGPVGHRKSGSFEGFCSGGGIADLARIMRCQQHPPSALDGLADEQLTARRIGQAAADGDQLARSVVQRSGHYLGRALAILVDIFNPELIVLGPLAWRLGQLWLAPARRVLQAEALPASLAACRIIPTALGEAIGDYAALAVALDGMAARRA
ncbi:MAG: ROK family protein [Phycisphaerae bacterium]